jgi:hypothetical protein
MILFFFFWWNFCGGFGFVIFDGIYLRFFGHIFYFLYVGELLGCCAFWLVLRKLGIFAENLCL